MEDPEGEDEHGVLLVGPVVVAVREIGSRHVGTLRVHSRQSSCNSKTVDSGRDKNGEVGDAEAHSTEACAQAHLQLVSADGDAAHVEDHEKHEETVGEEDVGETVALLEAVLVPVAIFVQFQ